MSDHRLRESATKVGAACIEELCTRFERDGYLVVPNAIPTEMLPSFRKRYDALIQSQDAVSDGRRLYVKRALEADPLLEDLMDWPSIFPIVRRVIGADITLGSAGEADCRPAHTKSWIGWHTDSSWMPGLPYPRAIAWIRCAYFIDDVTEEMGPFTLLPGSHRATEPPPPSLTGDDRDPKPIAGAVSIMGKAGTCLINNTEIWHTSTDNTSDRDRKLLMVLYKHAWMRQWEDGHDISPQFAERQTSPRRRQLCGVGVWHRPDWNWEIDHAVAQ